MTSTPPSDIKQKVRERYGAAALQNASCCDDDSVDIRLVDYSAFAVDVIAEADLGLGCGVPTLAADIRPGETVLDLGSGAGIDVFLAARAVGPQGRVIGVDMTPEMIARARENAQKGGFENVEFRPGELEAMPVEDDAIDVILSNCVINLVPDKSKVFDEIYRVLKPGGRFSISDIVTYGDVPEPIRQDIALWTGCIAGAMDQADYLALIQAAGFQNVRYEKEQRYDSSWIPDEYRRTSGHHVEESGGDFGIASVTVVGEK